MRVRTDTRTQDCGRIFPHAFCRHATNGSKIRYQDGASALVVSGKQDAVKAATEELRRCILVPYLLKIKKMSRCCRASDRGVAQIDMWVSTHVRIPHWRALASVLYPSPAVSSRFACSFVLLCAPLLSSTCIHCLEHRNLRAMRAGARATQRNNARKLTCMLACTRAHMCVLARSMLIDC